MINDDDEARIIPLKTNVYSLSCRHVGGQCQEAPVGEQTCPQLDSDDAEDEEDEEAEEEHVAQHR